MFQRPLLMSNCSGTMKTIPYGVLLLTAAIHLTETYAAHDLPAALAAVAHGQRLAATGAGDSSAPWVSADGRYVVFSSLAPNLVTNDPNGGLDVFRFDRSTKALQLVSIERTGQGAGNGRSTCLGISSDANRILFQSEATNLVANDTNGLSDVFVRDLSNGDTRLVSLDNAGLPAGPFLNSSLSSDGTLLLFEAMPRAWTTMVMVPRRRSKSATVVFMPL